MIEAMQVWKSLIRGSCLVAFFAFACGKGSNSNLEGEIAALTAMTVPEKGRLAASSGPERSGFSVTAAWEVETSLTPDAYLSWLSARLKPEWSEKSRNQRTAIFTRSFTGDVHSLQVDIIEAGPPLKLRLGFTALPS